MQPMKQDSATLLHRLDEAGIPVDVTVGRPELEFEQRGGVCDSALLVFGRGRVACVFEVGIRNRTSRRIRCVDLELRLPEADGSFYWLGDPRYEDSVEQYRVPGTKLIFDRDQVLNHVLLGDGILRPGALTQGLLLATGEPHAPGLRHGAFADATLVIIDDDWTEHSGVVKLWVDCSASLERKAQPRSPHNGLFARGSSRQPCAFKPA